MLMRLHSLLALCVLSCATGERAPSTPKVAKLRPGTYELRLCRVLCDAKHPQNVIRSGWIVLDSIPIDIRPFADSVRRALDDGLMMGASDSGAANGCFYVHEDRPEIHTLGGVLGGGLLYWSRAAAPGDSIVFAMYRSPDSGYEVVLAPTDIGLDGRGDSWGDDMPKPGYPDDVIAAKYLGPPDQSRCRDAGLAVLALMREYRDHIDVPPEPPKQPPNER